MGDLVRFPDRSAWAADTALSDVDLVCEQGLIGALLMSPGRSISKLPPTFSPLHYGDELHRTIHEAIIELGSAANIILIRRSVGCTVEDAKYLAQLLESANGYIVVDELANGVTEAHRRRQIASITTEITDRLALGTRDAPASMIVNMALASLDALMVDTHQLARGGGLDEALDQVLDQTERAYRGESKPGRSTGMRTVDEALGGLEDGTFNVLGARPGQGKTALAVQWAVNIARASKNELSGGGVLGFSLEMPRVALARRALAEAARIGVKDIKRGNVGGQFDRLVQVRKELANLPFWIEDAGGQSIVAIRQKARAAQRRYKRLSLIFVDHINIVRPEDIDRRNGATQAVGHISNALRDMSKEFECPVLCLSQLSRAVLSREDKRPTLGDLRQAGDIEQDADTVMFLHREETYLPKGEPQRSGTETVDKWQTRVQAWKNDRARLFGAAELIFDKVRDGSPCTVELRFDGPTTSFAEPSGGTGGRCPPARSEEPPDMNWPPHG